ncbi:MAG: 15-cis-phytoene synthase [Microgenomates bacterium OLB23]|nr:MAG: 15-cis-phytoene synthase [Microgenomates bacterium OLB23]
MKSSNKIFKNGSTTYYYSSIVFPEKVKKDVTDLYAYVRVMDDYVDSTKPKVKQFTAMWKQTQACWRGEKVTNRIVTDFVAVAQKHNFKWEWIEAFYRAMRMDLFKKKYRTYKELETYMYGSAEVIGLMMAQVMHLPQVAFTSAQLQGKAMQLINFVRDFSEDAHLKRTYLPLEDSKACGSFDALIRFEINRYYALQKQAAKGYAHIPRQYLVPIKTAADMYMWTAKVIEKTRQLY